MKPTDLILRCYIEKQDGVWVAACIDFCLAAQSSARQHAIDKLHVQIKDHIREAITQPQFTKQLLSRKAPLKFIAKYYLIKTKETLYSLTHNSKPQESVFNDCMPLKLA